MESKFDAVIGIDPDSDRHGVAIYVDGKLCRLEMLNTPELILDFIPATQEDYNVKLAIEDVCANKFIYTVNIKVSKEAQSKVGMSIGQVQQAQKELIKWLDRYCIKYDLHKPQKGNWANQKKLFEKITGWTGRSSADTRSAAYMGFLSLR